MHKINICCGEKPKNDYSNYDHRPEFMGENTKLSIDGYRLSELSSDSVEIIFVNEGGLESVERKMIKDTITRWFDILAPGGRLVIHVKDIYVLCNDFAYGRIDILKFEQIIKSYNTLCETDGLLQLFQSVGFELHSRCIIGHTGQMEFIKKGNE